MITEIAILNIKENMSEQFEINFKLASKIISSMKGYIDHQLLKNIEKENKYFLIVKWETLADHTEGFRKSDEYLEWKRLLHHFYDPFPNVEYYTNRELDA